ncbi:unnamed protein product [Allacma fusca]|uniref:SOWAHA-C winged helix-turn-helix domain-containing protein n=1 Tax=Allacma fusca TaxID=39272 RepID=A0A8J2KG57_9HEXA|nr:unnamed protein product [Allacma fusca]
MASNHLMSEEDVRQYFLQNNGIVRNTDIVNYFRFYLSDPHIRDEARVLFKSYVNKLSSVKTENGEKFLVLKRQYFHPIDGNGNGLPSVPPAFNQGQQAHSRSNFPSNHSQMVPNQIPYGGIPSGRISVSNLDPALPPPPHPPLQRSMSQKSLSQSHLYGSAYSLGSSNSNYNDPYLNYGNPIYPPPPAPPSIVGSNYSSSIPPSPYASNIQINYNPPMNSEYQMDYGLPPPPMNLLASPRRYPSPPSSSSLSSSGSSAARLPPPYRPPPPAARFSTGSNSAQQTSPYSQQSSSVSKNSIRNFPPRFSSPPGNFQNETATPAGPQYQCQRSLSVPGNLTPQQQQFEGPKYFEATNNLASPPPPVPPRSKRGTFSERSVKSMSVSMMEEMEESQQRTSNPNVHKEEEEDDGGFVRPERSSSMGGQGKGFAQLRRSRSEGPGIEGNAELFDNDKENLNIGGQSKSASFDTLATDESLQNGTCVNGNGNLDEQKISVKERLQKFNRIASESELTSGAAKMPSATRIRRENASKHDSVDYDTASLSSFGFGFAHMQPKEKEWILKASNCDYHALNKMAQENPSLVKRKDMNVSTALHWAAKHGNAELVKLLAGTFKSDINNKSNGGYTPLHLAAQFSRQDVYDILVNVYNADKNMRDHSGKKPMQYLVRQDATVSMDTFKKIKEKRRSTENRDRDSSFLRIGSLNVRVKKTTEAFGYFLGKSNSASNIERILHKSWGSADNLPEADGVEKDKDKQMMPPPAGNGIRRATSKANGKHTACGFGQEWKN